MSNLFNRNYAQKNNCLVSVGTYHSASKVVLRHRTKWKCNHSHRFDTILQTDQSTKSEPVMSYKLATATYNRRQLER